MKNKNPNKFVKAYQITPQSVSDIFNLKCIKRVEKMARGGFFFTTTWKKKVFIGDWLVQRADGTWTVYDDAQYQIEKLTKF